MNSEKDVRQESDSTYRMTNSDSEQQSHSPRYECENCDWTLTLADVVERLDSDDIWTASPDRVRKKFASLSEGHAFSRRHAVESKGDFATIDEEMIDDVR